MRLPLLALRSLAAALSLASAACARDNPDASSFSGGGSQTATSTADSSSTGDTSTSVSSAGSSSTSSSGSTSTGEDATSTTAAWTSAGTWDVGTTSDFDPPPIGCQGKIDFLFVIDSHFEMKVFQDRLKAAFHPFVSLLKQELADFDYQIMVVDAGGAALLNKCSECEGMCDGCQWQDCPEDYPCGPFFECDVTEGAGVTVVGNYGGSNKRCQLATENRYITTADAATLDASFACIATLGEGPKTPVVMESMMRALKPDMLDGGCNDGFVRENALLVVVAIQAAQDNGSPGTPASWYDTLVALKDGNEEAVVVLVISDDNDLPNSLCKTGLAKKNTLLTFAQTAANGRFGSVCAPEYGTFLQEGAALALDQCAVLVPQ